MPLDIYKWQGIYKKGDKTEKYQFYIEPLTEKFLGGKPLRKVTRTGKYSIKGGPFIRIPGHIRGKSLPHLIENPVNAFNTIWNQMIDFQFVQNMPFGWFKPDEHYKKQEYKLTPGVLFPTDDPQSVNMPNLQRSSSWAYQDMQMIFEVIEKLTGAASFFLTTERNTSGTATRDAIVNEKSQTRFGIWVSRLQEDICEALTALIGYAFREFRIDNVTARIHPDNAASLKVAQGVGMVFQGTLWDSATSADMHHFLISRDDWSDGPGGDR